MRESPAFTILERLRELGAEVSWHDPHVPELREQGGRVSHSVDLTDPALEEADCVVLVTDQRAFDLEWIWSKAQLLVDTRNATGSLARKNGEGHAQEWITKESGH